MAPTNFIWLSAEYNFAAMYSCRIPLTSIGSATVMPAPGPATVRLALIRTGIELFGIDYVRDKLFATIRSTKIYIRPPERIAISNQLIRAYKYNAGRLGEEDSIQETITYREFVHPMGTMFIYLQIPDVLETDLNQILKAIGYWGQSNSLAYCLNIRQTDPEPNECAIPLRSFKLNGSVRNFFSCVTSEFRDEKVEWDEVMPFLQATKPDAVRVEIYVWPMVIYQQHSNGKILCRGTFEA
ncbi:MAG: hypothetical protein HXX20_00315 [Chloroflexi bacterium]|nr:hypothetical protein [Chloroflexota bacterium]